ncbi:PhoH family protein [Neobacillus sp. 19]|uniref:PhoH family protein n=1 Tax=Neobacillus sp. 19 TaxID=3394458 RepID=UPI003BF6726F
MSNKYGDIRWKWLEERGFNVLADRHQYAYMQSLWMSPELVQGVFCESPAGTGKTVLAVLAGAYAVENEEYDKIIYIRNPQVVGKDIGFLPGDDKDKTKPFMQPFVKALEYVKPGTFELWSGIEKAFAITPTFERGVTYENAYIILDEAQSISLGELQTIYTRVTDSCKVVTTGSLLQIDDPRLKRYGGLTPFEVYMKHFEGQRATFHKLETNYRGWFSNHADAVKDTVKLLESY